MTIDEARAKAHQQYDDCMFCPGCSKLLTGLHMGSQCYTNWIEKNPQKFEEVKVLTEVALTSLAGAAVFYIAFLVAVNEVRKDIKRKRHVRRK